MAKVFLACFSPFNTRVRPFSSESSFPDDSESATLLASLILDLQVLEKSLEDGPISLKWCREAMFLIKAMHSHFLLFFFERISRVSGSWDRVAMMEEYLKESLDLLDLCNLLKSAVSEIGRQRMVADFAMRRSNDDVAIMRVKLESGRKASGVEKWKEKALYKVGSTNYIQNALDTLSLMVFSAILEPVPVKTDEPYAKAGQNSFSGCIWRLAGRFTERFEAAREGGNEVLWEMATKKSKSEELKEGLERFGSAIDEVFGDVIEGRKKVLDLIASKSTSLGKGDYL